MVFKFYCDDRFVSSASAEWKLVPASRTLTWRNLATLLVCRHWHAVMVAHPRLWTHVILHTQNNFDAALQRSGCLPLYVENIHTPEEMRCDEGHAQALKSVFEQIDRVKSLDLCIPTKLSAAFEDVNSMFSQRDAPRLENLCIEHRREYASAARWGPIGSTSKMPRLKYLKLRHFDFQLLTDMVRPTLTTLHVGRIHSLQTLYFWVDLLSGLPALQDLSLIYFRLKIAPLTPTPLPTARHKDLKKFNLVADFAHVESVAQLLPTMTFDRKRVDVTVRFEHLPPQEPPSAPYERLSALFRDLYPADNCILIGPWPGTNYVCTFFAPKKDLPRLYGVRKPRNDGNADGQDRFVVNVLRQSIRKNPEAADETFLPPIAQQLAPVLAGVEQLRTDIGLPRRAWSTFGPSLPNITVLEVPNEGALKTFLEAVMNAKPAEPALFPRLILPNVLCADKVDYALIDDWKLYRAAREQSKLTTCNLVLGGTLPDP